MTGAYLDYNATCIPRPAAAKAAAEVLAEGGNPSSIHASGRKARGRLESARAEIARLANARAEDVVLTSGATEANTQALSQPGVTRVLLSDIEHPSVLEAAPMAQRVPVTPAGVVDLNALRALLTGQDNSGTLVAIMAVNNETGVIQPLVEVAGIVAEAGARLHVDAVQAAGRIDLDIASLGTATLSLSGHKIGGPTGVGALVLAKGTTVSAMILGGGQERRRRGGTENLVGAVGFAAAASEVLASRDDEQSRIAALRDRLETNLATEAPNAMILGQQAPRVANTSCIALPGISAERQVIAMDLGGVQVSAGSACSSGKVAASHVLTAMGHPPEIAGTAIRVSLGWASGEADVDAFLEAYGRLAAKA